MPVERVELIPRIEYYFCTESNQSVFNVSSLFPVGRSTQQSTRMMLRKNIHFFFSLLLYLISLFSGSLRWCLNETPYNIFSGVRCACSVQWSMVIVRHSTVTVWQWQSPQLLIIIQNSSTERSSGTFTSNWNLRTKILRRLLFSHGVRYNSG